MKNLWDGGINKKSKNYSKMRMLIETEKDLQFLQGKFVLQVNSDSPDKTLMDFDWRFAKEKRLKLVCGKGFADLYGNVKEYDSFDIFKNVFNKYLFEHMIKEGESDGGRFHRLLTSRELDFLLQKIKEENY